MEINDNYLTEIIKIISSKKDVSEEELTENIKREDESYLVNLINENLTKLEIYKFNEKYFYRLIRYLEGKYLDTLLHSPENKKILDNAKNMIELYELNSYLIKKVYKEEIHSIKLFNSFCDKFYKKINLPLVDKELFINSELEKIQNTLKEDQDIGRYFKLYINGDIPFLGEIIDRWKLLKMINAKELALTYNFLNDCKKRLVNGSRIIAPLKSNYKKKEIIIDFKELFENDNYWQILLEKLEVNQLAEKRVDGKYLLKLNDIQTAVLAKVLMDKKKLKREISNLQDIRKSFNKFFGTNIQSKTFQPSEISNAENKYKRLFLFIKE